MEFTDGKPQRLIKIKEEESCTDFNTEINDTAYTEIKTEYSKCHYVVKRELEIDSTSDKIKPVLLQNIKKEEIVFEDGHYITSELTDSSSNNYTSQLQTVVEQFEINQPNHASHEIKTEIPFYFTDSMNLKNETNHDTSHSSTTELNAQNNQLDVSNRIKTETPSDFTGSMDLRNYFLKQSSLEGYKHETENSNHAELITHDIFERNDTVVDSNSREAFTTAHKTHFETTSGYRDAVFSHNINDLSEILESPVVKTANGGNKVPYQCHSYGAPSKRYRCEMCGMKSIYKHSILDHIRDVHLKLNKKHLICTLCDKSFSRKCDLNTHNKSVHQKVKYTCTECDTQFSRNSALDSHIQSIHKQVKNTCTQCDKQFSAKSDLKRHIQSIHEQVKYICTECDKQFSLKSHLKQHIQSIHEQVKYTCTVCDKQFSEKGSLKRHIQSIHVQRKYACTECDKQFSQKSHLKRHIQSLHEQR